MILQQGKRTRERTLQTDGSAGVLEEQYCHSGCHWSVVSRAVIGRRLRTKWKPVRIWHNGKLRKLRRLTSPPPPVWSPNATAWFIWLEMATPWIISSASEDIPLSLTVATGFTRSTHRLGMEPCYIGFHGLGLFIVSDEGYYLHAWWFVVNLIKWK